MKIKTRPHDASVRQDSDWLQTDGWLAALRDDDRAGPDGDGRASTRRGQKLLLRRLPGPRPLLGPRLQPGPRPLRGPRLPGPRPRGRKLLRGPRLPGLRLRPGPQLPREL